MLIKISFRNIFRNKRRNFLTLSFMTCGIGLAIFYDGIIKGFTYQTLEISRKTDIGNYKIYGKNYYKDRDENEKLDFLFEPEDFFKKYKINEFTERLNFDGTISSGDNSIPVIFYGVNSEKEKKYFGRDSDMYSGDFLEGKKAVVIGTGIAKDLGLKLHDKITLITRTVQKSINAYDLEVTGIIKTQNSLLNKNIVFLNLDFAKEFTLAKGINELIVLDKKLGNIKEYDNISLETEMDEVINLMKIKGKNANNSILLILLMGAVGIANIMLMAMLEREKEIGIMLASGMETRDIKLLFLLESFFLGVLGSGLGFVLGVVSVVITGKYGIPLPVSYFESMDLNMILPDRMYAIISMKNYFLYFAFGVIISTLAGLYSANKSTKIEPLDVLRD